ncbi:DgaE family pyridoxal phosphate-dependent ammonia lyase [Clostridium tertium]|uniref:L-seryl-tRNA(Sec) selenium transferase n=1 Tax=Clostridium tertium TaxID=1559 RepID=A0A6N3BRE6_9CLOT
MSDNIYEKFNVKKVINASGKMTILGGSRVNSDVLSYMKEGASNFYEVKDLLDKTGEYISRILNVEASYIVSSASSGIAQCIAAAISKEDYSLIMNLYNEDNNKREIIIPKGHIINYGTAIDIPISMGGGRIKEAGYSNKCEIKDVEALINDNTAALIYIKSHHCVQKGILDIDDYIEIGKKYNLPVIVDAAAEEDLIKYYNLGADAVIYSGTKALEGPTSGIVIGKREFINNLKLQGNGIGRVMKIGKENILGLTKAIEIYINKNKLSIMEQEERLNNFNLELNKINGVQAVNKRDEAGRAILRSEIFFDENITKISAVDIIKRLKSGEIKIYTRDYKASLGKIEIDIRDVSDDELNIILTKIKEILKV